MNINVIGNLNLMSVYQSDFVIKDTIDNDSSLFEQLLLLSEQYSQPANKTTQTKSSDIDNEELDDNNATDDELTIGGYPVAVEYFEHEKLAIISATEINAVENRDIPTNSYSLPTNKVNFEILQDNLLNNLPTNSLDSETINEIIHDEGNLVNLITQQNNFISLFEAKHHADTTFINPKNTEINHNTSNYLSNSSNNLSNISDVMPKMISAQTDFVMNLESNDVIVPILQVSNLITQQNNFISLFEAKRHADTTFINPKNTEINHSTSNYLSNSSNNLSNISGVMPKMVSAQTDFVMNLESNDVIAPIHQVSSLSSSITNEPSLLLPANSTVTTYTMDLSTPVNVEQWQKSLTQHIMMFNHQGTQSAEIKLQPQELGSLHIKLAITDDNINLHMMTEHNMVKGVLESALPFLRTSLQEQGFTLQQTDISDFSMMRDGEQSAMHHENNHRQQSNTVVPKKVDKINEQPNNEKHLVKSGLSVFA
ncbi:flagellar hook-length control protein FliK [Gilliamella apicola]|uniref:flagellar hook-length control protein FliK n=1 Tax=Gilliamella apicola TaxID=1196095 RepID=UPI000D78530A|nr:flagellar hook-length control protein FliK [Gilliamella apicola]PXY98099.1 hypothetical protein DKK69_11970 [Gilliamella apicola]WLS91976.1 flagellar hook-length control protein FliK [Gilliamella apicola]